MATAMSIPELKLEDVHEWVERARRPYHRNYYAMYSSVYGAIVRDPVLMCVPVDDHLVHRGDGVFETLKCVRGAIYNLPAHLERLGDSARQIGLALPVSGVALEEVLIETVRAGGRAECILRVLVSRGPGSLGVNPYDCPRPELYVVAAAPGEPFMSRHPRGARVGLSALPVKPGFLANIKSCNYLLNALMKKEALDAGLDFVFSLDEDGHLAEAPAESIALVTRSGRLRFPASGRILPGTTQRRTEELAERLVEQGHLAAVESGALTVQDAREAAELLILGTTPDVAAVTEFDGAPVGTGAPGPACIALGRLLTDDILHNPDMRTEVFNTGPA
jgi:branched-chain amino acid aminotransferase